MKSHKHHIRRRDATYRYDTYIVAVRSVTFVPACMAVDGVGGGTGAWNRYTRKKQNKTGEPGRVTRVSASCPAPLCRRAPVRHTSSVCACASRKLLEESAGVNDASVDGQSNTSPRVKGGSQQGISCSRRGTEGRRCCWLEGREDPGTIVTRPGWRALEAAAERRRGRGEER